MFPETLETQAWFRFLSLAVLILGAIWFVGIAFFFESGRRLTPTVKTVGINLAVLILFPLLAPSEGSRLWSQAISYVDGQQEWVKIIFKAATAFGLVYLGQLTYYLARYKTLPPFTDRKRLFSLIALAATIFLIGLTLHFRFERARPHAHFWN